MLPPASLMVVLSVVFREEPLQIAIQQAVLAVLVSGWFCRFQSGNHKQFFLEHYNIWNRNWRRIWCCNCHSTQYSGNDNPNYFDTPGMGLHRPIWVMGDGAINSDFPVLQWQQPAAPPANSFGTYQYGFYVRYRNECKFIVDR